MRRSHDRGHHRNQLHVSTIPWQRNHLQLERSLIVIIPFMSYMISEGLSFSGVVAILFTGTGAELRVGLDWLPGCEVGSLLWGAVF